MQVPVEDFKQEALCEIFSMVSGISIMLESILELGWPWKNLKGPGFPINTLFSPPSCPHSRPSIPNS